MQSGTLVKTGKKLFVNLGAWAEKLKKKKKSSFQWITA